MAFGTGAFFVADAGRQAIRSADRADRVTRLADSPPKGDYLLLRRSGLRVASATVAERISTDHRCPRAGHGSQEVCDGVICVPALAGSPAPCVEPERRATFTGMTLTTGRAQLITAVIEGSAAQVTELMDIVATTAPAVADASGRRRLTARPR